VGKSGRCVRLTTLTPSCAVVTKSENLNFLEPSGPLQACNNTAVPLPFTFFIVLLVAASEDVSPPKFGTSIDPTCCFPRSNQYPLYCNASTLCSSLKCKTALHTRAINLANFNNAGSLVLILRGIGGEC
jgi:hypothetical protein